MAKYTKDDFREVLVAANSLIIESALKTGDLDFVNHLTEVHALYGALISRLLFKDKDEEIEIIKE